MLLVDSLAQKTGAPADSFRVIGWWAPQFWPWQVESSTIGVGKAIKRSIYPPSNF
jgi:hypothetical protein